MADKIVGPDGRVPSSMKSIHTAMSDKAKMQADKPLTEGRAAELITAGLIGGLKNIVDHFEEHNKEHMLTMEVMVYQRIKEDLYRESIRGRLHLRWLMLKEWAMPWLIELGAADPVDVKPDVKLETGS